MKTIDIYANGPVLNFETLEDLKQNVKVRKTLFVPEKYSNDIYNNIYAGFSNKDEFQRFYDENKEKIDDYTKFGWKMHYTAEFVARSIVDDLYLEY